MLEYSLCSSCNIDSVKTIREIKFWKIISETERISEKKLCVHQQSVVFSNSNFQSRSGSVKTYFDIK